ncbi:hypothetical protein BDV11DRAFT_110521 [Aspergillus similis]
MARSRNSSQEELKARLDDQASWGRRLFRMFATGCQKLESITSRWIERTGKYWPVGPEQFWMGSRSERTNRERTHRRSSATVNTVLAS